MAIVVPGADPNAPSLDQRRLRESFDRYGGQGSWGDVQSSVAFPVAGVGAVGRGALSAGRGVLGWARGALSSSRAAPPARVAITRQGPRLQRGLTGRQTAAIAGGGAVSLAPLSR